MPDRTSPRVGKRCVAIVAGGGSLPGEIAQSLAARGLAFHIVAIEGEADALPPGLPVTRVGWGGIGAMLKAVGAAGATDLMFVGRVRRPDLRTLRPDLGFLTALPEILPLITRGGGDDAVLRGVLGFFERRGLKIVGPLEIAPELLVGHGVLGRQPVSQNAVDDIALGMEIVRQLGRHDVGQGVVVADGTVEAVEASENTDAMLERVARARRSAGVPASARRGVLVKRPKPGQDLRIDLPAIGPDTVSRAADACLAGIAVLAGGAIAARRAELVQRADTAALFVAGVEDTAAPTKAIRSPYVLGPWQALTRRRASDAEHDAAEIGCAVAETLSVYDAGLAVVVARKHVVAVEAGEGVLATIVRAGRQRQWGEARTRKRRGVAVLRGGALTAEIVAAADAARLKGIALLAANASSEVVAMATRAGLFIIARTWQRSGER